MRQETRLPDIWTGLAILAGLFGLQILIAAAYFDLGDGFSAGDPAAIGVITVLANGIVFTIVLKVTGLTYSELFHSGGTSVRAMLVLLSFPIALLMIGANWWFVDLCRLVVPIESISRVEFEMLTRMVRGGVVSFITVGIVAPVLEEMLFRGILLRGFLEHYEARTAIVSSAAVFAIFHFTLSQLPLAFGIGCFLGWLYWRTRSLWPCILAHAIYNVTSLSIYANSSDDEIRFMSPEWSVGDLAVDAFSFVVSAVGFLLLWRLLRREVSEETVN